MGSDECGKIWYERVPVEFNSFSREFTADCLTLVEQYAAMVELADALKNVHCVIKYKPV